MVVRPPVVLVGAAVGAEFRDSCRQADLACLHRLSRALPFYPPLESVPDPLHFFTSVPLGEELRGA